jgi:hypothetical protein
MISPCDNVGGSLSFVRCKEWCLTRSGKGGDISCRHKRWLLVVGCRELLCYTHTDPVLVLSCNCEASMKDFAVIESASYLSRQTQRHKGWERIRMHILQIMTSRQYSAPVKDRRRK